MNAARVVAALGAAAAIWCFRPGALRRGPLTARGAPLWGHAWRDVLRGSRGQPASYGRDIAVLTSALSAELRSGQSPHQAWTNVLQNAVGRLPGTAMPETDVVLVLHRWARRPGWRALEAVAACWRLADTTGAGLADALDRLGEAMRHEHEVAVEVHGQLAAARATAAVLATLPILAVALGSLLGADLLAVLLGTTVGLTCLALGLSLTATGFWWVARQVADVRRAMSW